MVVEIGSRKLVVVPCVRSKDKDRLYVNSGMKVTVAFPVANKRLYADLLFCVRAIFSAGEVIFTP